MYFDCKNYKVWLETYDFHLQKLYDLTGCEYEHKRYNKFCKLIYNRSSRYISPFIK